MILESDPFGDLTLPLNRALVFMRDTAAEIVLLCCYGDFVVIMLCYCYVVIMMLLESELSLEFEQELDLFTLKINELKQ
jgi:hypothetical protein